MQLNTLYFGVFQQLFHAKGVNLIVSTLCLECYFSSFQKIRFLRLKYFFLVTKTFEKFRGLQYMRLNSYSNKSVYIFCNFFTFSLKVSTMLIDSETMKLLHKTPYNGNKGLNPILEETVYSKIMLFVHVVHCVILVFFSNSIESWRC